MMLRWVCSMWLFWAVKFGKVNKRVLVVHMGEKNPYMGLDEDGIGGFLRH